MRARSPGGSRPSRGLTEETSPSVRGRSCVVGTPQVESVGTTRHLRVIVHTTPKRPRRSCFTVFDPLKFFSVYKRGMSSDFGSATSRCEEDSEVLPGTTGRDEDPLRPKTLREPDTGHGHSGVGGRDDTGTGRRHTDGYRGEDYSCGRTRVELINVDVSGTDISSGTSVQHPPVPKPPLQVGRLRRPEAQRRNHCRVLPNPRDTKSPLSEMSAGL